MALNVVILAAGSEVDEDNRPVFLVEQNGRLALEYIYDLVDTLNPKSIRLCVKVDDLKVYNIASMVKLISRETQIISLKQPTAGSGCTALLLASRIAQDEELLLISANELLQLDLNEHIEAFRKRQLDGAMFVFKSINPIYSFIRLGKDGEVVEVSQKNPISSLATTGCFWFRKCSQFVSAAQSMILKNATVDGNYFIAPCYNEMILEKRKIGVGELDKRQYKPLKSKTMLKNTDWRFT